MIEDIEFKHFDYNVIGSKSFIKGDIELSGDSIINSRIEGTIEVSGNGKLILERGSFIKGNIKAVDLEIFGQVEGIIECSGVVSIRANAFVSGEIRSSKLVIYPGAIVEIVAHSELKT